MPPLDARRQHPIAMLRYTGRYLFLLAIPTARGLVYIRTPSGFYRWLSGAWIDLTALTVLIVLPLWIWRRYTYALSDDGFCIRRGILLRRIHRIPRAHIATLSLERPLWLRPFRAVRVRIDTDAGRRFDGFLIVGERDAREILARRQPGSREILAQARPRARRIAAMALLSSHSLNGVLLIATAFRRIGALIDEEWQRRLIGNLDAVAGAVTGISRTTARIATLLLIGWLAAAGHTFLRYLPFRVRRCPSVLSVRTGLITRRDDTCRLRSIHYVDLRQTLLGRVCRRWLVGIHCAGYGKGRHALAVLLPTCPGAAAVRRLRRLLPDYRLPHITVRPAARSLYRYVFYPLWGLLLLSPLAWEARRLFPVWRELIGSLTVFAAVPCGWLLLVKTVDRYTAGVGRRGGIWLVRYSRFYTFHTVLIPADRIVVTEITQTIFQRRAHTADLRFYTPGEPRQRHRVRNLSSDDILTLLASLEEDRRGSQRT